MPIYEYTCNSCAAEFELLVRDTDEPICPECDGQELNKLFSVPSAHSSGTSELPISGGPAPSNCGSPMCQSKCQFE